MGVYLSDRAGRRHEVIRIRVLRRAVSIGILFVQKVHVSLGIDNKNIC